MRREVGFLTFICIVVLAAIPDPVRAWDFVSGFTAGIAITVLSVCLLWFMER